MSEPFSQTDSTSLSILIVEDEAMISMMLEEYLEALGHKVAANASSLDEARVIIEGTMPDLAILDCYLGSEEIWPVADILTERGVPVILSSGGSTSTLPERYASCPMLQKPYTIGALSDILERAG